MNARPDTACVRGLPAPEHAPQALQLTVPPGGPPDLNQVPLRPRDALIIGTRPVPPDGRQTASRARVRTSALLLWLALGLLLGLLLPVRTVRAALPRPDLLIADVRLLDVAAGRIRGPHDVWIVGGRIAAIGAPGKLAVPTDVRRLAGRGLFLLPGLVDLHVHLFNNASGRAPNTWTFPLFLAHGVTGVREMAARPADLAMVRAWRTAVAHRELLAPRVLSAGVPVPGRGTGDIAQQVDAAAAAGADFIKVFSEISASDWRTVLAAAQSRRLPVAGHVPAALSLASTAVAGLSSSEHLMQAFEACTRQEAQWLAPRAGLGGAALLAVRDRQEPAILAAFDARVCRHRLRALQPAGQAQIPTLVLYRAESQASSAAPEADPRWPWLRADEQARWLRIHAAMAQTAPGLAAQRWRVARRLVGQMQRVQLPVLAGTDTPMPGVYPGWSLHEELASLVDAGLTPAQALYAATLGPARWLGLADRRGRVAPGQDADLVLLDANPLRDIRHSRRIRAVILAGRLLDRAQLDRLLEDARLAVPGGRP